MSSTSSSGNSGGPGESGGTHSGSAEPPHQHQQRRHQQQQGQEHDVPRMLDLALSNLSRPQLGPIAPELHPTSRAHRSLALSALTHLSLQRFDNSQYCTCEAVYRDSLDNGCFSRAVVPDPPIPWRTLAALAAAGGCLQSLDIRQCQAEPLLAGATQAATAPVLAATLAGLRCLRVTEVVEEEDGDVLEHFGGEQPDETHRPVQLRCVARLISSCSGLTKLVLEACGGDWGMDGSVLTRVWSAAAEDEDQEEEQGQGEEEQGRHGSRPVVMLPQLRHLEVEGWIKDFLPTFVGAGGAGSLTSCRLASQGGVDTTEEVDFIRLAACNTLQELQLEGCWVVAMEANGTIPPQHLLRNTAFTKLVLDNCNWYGDVLPAVCVATQLRHLDLRNNADLVAVLPADLSSLQRLTFLEISGTGVTELPQQLGQWLPQLQVLGVEKTKVAAIPQGMQRLIRLKAAHSAIPSVVAVQHLVRLQQLQLHGNTLVPPYQQLSLFTALQELSLSISEGGAQVDPSALPLLKALRLKALDPLRAAAQLVGPGRHLTSLGMYSTWRGMERAAAVGQLGVLPVLQQLVLSMPLSGVRAAGPWLLQQPQLTSLSMAWCHSPHEGSEQPRRYGELGSPSLQRLCLRRGVPQDGLPDALVQLTGLRVLRLSGPCTAQLPAWVSCLARLSVLHLGEGFAPTSGNAAAWAVLGHMPLLRRVEAEPKHVDGCLRQLRLDSPCLFSGVKCCTDSDWHSL